MEKRRIHIVILILILGFFAFQTEVIFAFNLGGLPLEQIYKEFKNRLEEIKPGDYFIPQDLFLLKKEVMNIFPKKVDPDGIVKKISDLFVSIKNSFSISLKSGGNFKLAAKISLGEESDIKPNGNKKQIIESSPPIRKTENKKENTARVSAREIIPQEKVPKDDQPEVQAEKKEAPASTIQTKTAKDCSFNTSSTPLRNRVLINEVAWMGGKTSANDEWIEFKNITPDEIDISHWQLLGKDEHIKIIFEKNDKIPGHGFYLLERTSDDSAPNVIADKIYTGALSNSDEGLRLFNDECVLIDEVLTNSGSNGKEWPAGDNSSAEARKTMERDSSGFGWHTSSVVGGTPKSENSAPQIMIPVNEANNAATSEIAAVPIQPLIKESAASTSRKISISKIQTGTDKGANDEFVELYNGGDEAVNLAGWSLKKKTSSGAEYNLVASMSSTSSIQSKSFFLIAHRDYKGDKIPDLFYSNNSNPLAYINNSVLLYDKNDLLINEVLYAEIPKNQIFEPRP